MDEFPTHRDSESRQQRRRTATSPTVSRSDAHLARTAIICATIYFLHEFSDYVVMAPRLRLFELGFCREYYRVHDPSKIGDDGSVDEALCKHKAIQALVVNYRGWQLALNAIPGILSIPLSYRSNKYGRKRYMALALVGNVLYLAWTHLALYMHTIVPTSAVISASAFLLIGGGPAVVDTMASSIMSDVSTQSQLTTRFSWILGSFFLAEMLGPAVSAPLQSWSPWAPAFVAISALICAGLLLYTFPETIHAARRSKTRRLGDEDAETGEEPTWKSLKPAQWRQLLLPLSVFLVSPLRNTVVEITTQYVSKKFGIKLSSSAFLTSLIGIYSFIFYIGILPPLRAFWEKRSGTPSVKIDHSLTKFNLGANSIGALLIGASPSILCLAMAALVFTTGTGVRVTWLPVLIACVDVSSVATLCAAASVIEYFGVLAFSPLLALATSTGFGFEGTLTGLPFFSVSVLYLAGLTVVTLFPPRPLSLAATRQSDSIGGSSSTPDSDDDVVTASGRAALLEG
ncbi:major facilitator superfamily domain-containing protein [Cercophora newfieldiana]|uniref:Major facilitator superfamily domain-containing protein n=1 Tax=Cercophora newfieldiana TaxID=92897 RepID=A0AA40CUQ8_9PEZI|nr:major facilitator superfamily domain-containing protein [Cercophora newfieldiana]